VIIGPGPGSPEDDAYFGFCKHIINEHGRNGLPIFGICLGFQGLFALFGGQLCPAKLPVHGKVSRLNLTSAGINSPLLAQIETDTNVMRYHSIMADLTKPVPDCFELLAFAEPLDLNAKPSPNGQELMAIAHKHLPLFGVQFHPESFATDCGVDLARNFVEICRGQSSVGSLCESNPS